MSSTGNTTTGQYSKDSANAERPFLSQIKRLFADPELKAWRKHRYGQLKNLCKQQEYRRWKNRQDTKHYLKNYFKTAELILKTSETLAENVPYLRHDPFITALYASNPAAQARPIIEDEDLPFEVKNGRLYHTGGPDRIFDDALDLVAALDDRAPEILDNHAMTDVEWLSRYLDGFKEAYEAERDRIRKMNALTDNRIIRSDGRYTELGRDMLERMEAEAKESEQCLKEIEAEERELFDEVKHSFMADTTAAVNPGLFTLPLYALAKKSIDRKKRAHTERVGRPAEIKAALEEIARPGKRTRWRGTLRKAGAVGAASLMTFSAIAGAAGGDDDGPQNASDIVKNFDHPDDHSDIHSRAGYNADAYNYSLPLDQQHPIETIQLKGDTRNSQPGLFEDEVSYVIYNQSSEMWELRLLDLETKNDTLLKEFWEDTYVLTGYRVAFYGDRIILGGDLDSSHLYRLSTGQFSYNAYDISEPDLWKSTLVGGPVGFDVQNYSTSVINLSTGERKEFKGWCHFAASENKMVLPVIRNDTSIVDLKVIDLDTGESEIVPVNGLYRDYFAGNPLDMYRNTVIVSNGPHNSPLVVDLNSGAVKKMTGGPLGGDAGYMAFVYSPQIYKERIIWPHEPDNGDKLKVMHLDKWLPQLNLPDELTAIEGRPFVYQANGSHPTSPVLDFTDDSPLFDINRTTGKIAFTPQKPGTYYINITVATPDGFNTTKQSKLVVKTNHPPAFTNLPDWAEGIGIRIPAKVGPSGYPFNYSGRIFNISATDKDNDTLIYTLQPSPFEKNAIVTDEKDFQKICFEDGACFWLDKLSGELTGSGKYILDKRYYMGVAVSDGGASVYDDIWVSFDRNNPPSLPYPVSFDSNVPSSYDSIKKARIFEAKDEPIILWISARDYDNDILDFRLESYEEGKGYAPVGTVNVTNYLNAKFTWQPNRSILAKCRIVADDGYDESYTDEFWINYNKTKPEAGDAPFRLNALKLLRTGEQLPLVNGKRVHFRPGDEVLINASGLGDAPSYFIEVPNHPPDPVGIWGTKEYGRYIEIGIGAFGSSDFESDPLTYYVIWPNGERENLTEPKVKIPSSLTSGKVTLVASDGMNVAKAVYDIDSHKLQEEHDDKPRVPRRTEFSEPIVTLPKLANGDYVKIGVSNGDVSAYRKLIQDNSEPDINDVVYPSSYYANEPFEVKLKVKDADNDPLHGLLIIRTADGEVFKSVPFNGTKVTTSLPAGDYTASVRITDGMISSSLYSFEDEFYECWYADPHDINVTERLGILKPAADFITTNWMPLTTLIAVGAAAAGTYRGVRAMQRARERRRKIIDRAKKLGYPNRGLYEI